MSKVCFPSPSLRGSSSVPFAVVCRIHLAVLSSVKQEAPRDEADTRPAQSPGPGSSLDSSLPAASSSSAPVATINGTKGSSEEYKRGYPLKT